MKLHVGLAIAILAIACGLAQGVRSQAPISEEKSRLIGEMVTVMELDKQFPQYGFAKHKGYSTPEHLEALQLHGPCDIHRKSFAPVKSYFQATVSPTNTQLHFPVHGNYN